MDATVAALNCPFDDVMFSRAGTVEGLISVVTLWLLIKHQLLALLEPVFPGPWSGTTNG